MEQVTIASTENEEEKKSRESSDKIVKECKEAFTLSKDYTEEMYRIMKEDLRFLDGEQWDANLAADRNRDGRPCLTINKLPAFLDQIVGDQRLNRPSIKIKPVDSNADKDTAEILTGLIRCIEVYSNAAYAYDTGFDAAAGCGFGAWRIVTDYTDPYSFDQEIMIDQIENQFTVYLDPNAKKWDYSDAEFVIVTELMPRAEFKAKYPKAGMSDWDASRDSDDGWNTGDSVRVAEYFKKEYQEREIVLVLNKETKEHEVFDSKEEYDKKLYDVINTRKSKLEKIVWYRVSGSEILEGPKTWPGKYFPIIPVWGKKLNIEGKKKFRGIVRHSKDPQRLYNYNRSMSAEAISLAPRTPFLLTPKQINGFEAKWKLANKKNFVYLPYNPDPQAPPPQRQPANPLSTGIQTEIMVTDQELHDTSGLQQSNLGKSSNEKSGKAIIARQQEGNVGSYDYKNSFINALMHTGKVLVDLIPKIYDAARVIRIIGEDGEDSMIPINQEVEIQTIDQKISRIYDFSIGKYDVVVSTGPSFTTQRDEARSQMMEFLQYVPTAGPLVADLVAKNMDWPGADEFAKRLKPQGVDEEMTPEMRAKQEMLVEAEMRTMDAKTKQEELKAEQLELENIELAAKITDTELAIAQKVMGKTESGSETSKNQ